MKWTQQYEGPYLVLKMLSSLTAKIQQSSRHKPKVVHINKLKKYEGVAPRMWSTAIVAVGAQRDGDQKGVTDPYAVLLGNERSEAESAARASGEAHHGEGRESADGLTAPPLTQESGNVQELLCPKQTRSLGPLAPIDGSASQVRILTETPGHNCVLVPQLLLSQTRWRIVRSSFRTTLKPRSLWPRMQWKRQGYAQILALTVPLLLQ